MRGWTVRRIEEDALVVMDGIMMQRRMETRMEIKLQASSKDSNGLHNNRFFRNDW